MSSFKLGNAEFRFDLWLDLELDVCPDLRYGLVLDFEFDS